MQANNKNILFDYQAVFEVDDYLYFYGEWLTEERSQSEVDMLVKLLGLSAPIDILDLACGFGRHTIRLAQLGHRVTGVDFSEGFIEIARHAAEKPGLSLQYICADMREIRFVEQFDLALLLFTSFGYFSDEDNLKVLMNIACALRPGGRFIMDTHNRDVYLRNMQAFRVTEKEANLMIDRESFDTMTGRWYNRRIVIRDGIRRDKPFFVRLYNPSEITQLLAHAGLRLEHIYSGWSETPLTSDSQRMVIIASKE